MYLSPSLIKTYNSCKFKFKLQYVDKIKKPQPITDETLYGNYFHRFQELYKRKKTSEIIQQLNEEIELPKHIQDDLIKAIGNTVRFVKQYDDYKCESEQYLRSSIRNTQLGGKIDRIYTLDKQLVVIDFKTSKKFWRGFHDLQLKFYSLVTSNERNIAPENIETIVYFARPDKADSNIYTAKDIEYFKEFLIETAETIENTRSWPAQKSKLCDYCQYREDCPID